MSFTRLTDAKPLLKICMYDEYDLDGLYQKAKKERFQQKTKDAAKAWVKREMEENPILKKDTFMETLKTAIAAATKNGPVNILLGSYAVPMFWADPNRAFKLTEEGVFTTYELHVKTLPSALQPPTIPCEDFHEGVRIGDLVSKTSVCDLLAAHIGGNVEVTARTKLTYAYPAHHQEDGEDCITIKGYYHGDTEPRNIYSIARCDVTLKWHPYGLPIDTMERYVNTLTSYNLLDVVLPSETEHSWIKQEIYKYLLGHTSHMTFKAQEVFDRDNGPDSESDHEDERCYRYQGYSCECRFCDDDRMYGMN